MLSRAGHALFGVVLGCACSRAGTEPEAPLALPREIVREEGVRPGATGAGEDYVKRLRAKEDLSVRPCDNFYRYACGGWLDRTSLPPGSSLWGTFSEVARRNNERLHAIFERAAEQRPSDPPDLRKVGAYFAACMDEAAIDQAGVAPIKPLLDRVDGVRTLAQYARLLGELHIGLLTWSGTLFEINLTRADDKRPGFTLVQIDPGRLGMHDPSFYLGAEEAQRETRRAYEGHVRNVLVLSGLKTEEATTLAKNVLRLETKLAEVSVSPEERRDPKKTYNLFTLRELRAENRDFPWSDYFQGMRAPLNVGPLKVTAPRFMQSMSRLLRGMDIRTLRAYLRFRLVRSQIPNLSSELRSELARFESVLSGSKDVAPRTERCVEATVDAFEDLAGRFFVEATFPDATREQAVVMAARIVAALRKRIECTSWMDPATRAQALEKLGAISIHVGYPDVERDYSTIVTTPDSHLANVIAVADHRARVSLDRVGKPLTRGEWFIPASAAAAFYKQPTLEVFLPAGLLAPPFFDRGAPLSVNYGAMGSLIGHELTHAFDDSGRKYDKQGLLHDWWSAPAHEAFEKHARCIEELYSSVEVRPGLHVNGKLTLGENIADRGGIAASFDAYREAAGKQRTSRSDELFFLGYAQSWCFKATEERERLLVATDSHTMSEQRVNTVLGAFPAFRETFGCTEAASMSPKAKCEDIF